MTKEPFFQPLQLNLTLRRHFRIAVYQGKQRIVAAILAGEDHNLLPGILVDPGSRIAQNFVAFSVRAQKVGN